MAFARCHPTDRYRPIFNHAHRLVGTAALACACKLFFGVESGSFTLRVQKHEVCQELKTAMHTLFSAAAIWFTTSFGVFNKKYGDAPTALMIFFFCSTIAVSIAFEVFAIVVYIRQRRATSEFSRVFE